MKNYEKPEVITTTDLSEGVYAASGAVPGDGNPGTPGDGDSNWDPACHSVYMNGEWHKPNHGAAQGTNIQIRGCEGCSADDGDGCKIKKGKGKDLNPDGVFKPTWEQNGESPEALVW